MKVKCYFFADIKRCGKTPLQESEQNDKAVYARILRSLENPKKRVYSVLHTSSRQGETTYRFAQKKQHDTNDIYIANGA